MLAGYRDLFSVPGVRQPWLANASWRAQGTMASLALLLYAQQQASLQLAGFSAGVVAAHYGTGWLFAVAIGVLCYGTLRAAIARLDPRA